MVEILKLDNYKGPFVLEALYYLYYDYRLLMITVYNPKVWRVRRIYSFAKQFEIQDRDAFLAARLAEAAFDEWKGFRDGKMIPC